MDQKLTLGSKFRYGLADLGFSLITSAMQFFLLFYYTDVAGINPALSGVALMVGKLTWDAFNDPLFGYWSDRTRSRFGRRRIYMLIGAVPLGIAAWIIFSLPKGLTGVPAFFAVLLSFWLVDTFHTMTATPYYALTPELTRDYTERASLTSIRMVYNVVGYNPRCSVDHHPGRNIQWGRIKPASGLERHWRGLWGHRYNYYSAYHIFYQGTT